MFFKVVLCGNCVVEDQKREFRTVELMDRRLNLSCSGYKHFVQKYAQLYYFPKV